MSSDARRTLWVAVLAGVLGFAAVSSLHGLFFNEDFLYLSNLGVLVWAGTKLTAPEHARRRDMAVMANLFALTILAGRAAAEGIFPSLQHWLRLEDAWYFAALPGLNYLVHVWLRIQAYRAAPRGRHHLIRRLLATGGLVLLLPVLWLMLAADYPWTSLVERRMVSSTLMYEKWVVDVGGTSGGDCAVFRIRNLGLVAHYQRIDPDHGDPSPISGGCGL